MPLFFAVCRPNWFGTFGKCRSLEDEVSRCNRAKTAYAGTNGTTGTAQSCPPIHTKRPDVSKSSKNNQPTEYKTCKILHPAKNPQKHS
jgi:hypothetical protein